MRILVAEDDAPSARGLAALLEMLGHRVIGPAADGEEAVALADREAPDLAIMDLDLPALSGLDAVERMTRRRPVPVIVLTGNADAANVDRAARLPVFHFLTKPAGADRLIPAIALARARFEDWNALHGEVGELSRRLEERKIVERAKGILMQARGLAEGDAYALLRAESQKRRRPLVDVARTLIAAGSLVAAPPATAAR